MPEYLIEYESINTAKSKDFFDSFFVNKRQCFMAKNAQQAKKHIKDAIRPIRVLDFYQIHRIKLDE